MTVGAVADIHGNFEALTRAMDRHPDVPLWICVGDVASRTGAYPTPSRYLALSRKALSATLMKNCDVALFG